MQRPKARILLGPIISSLQLGLGLGRRAWPASSHYITSESRQEDSCADAGHCISFFSRLPSLLLSSFLVSRHQATHRTLQLFYTSTNGSYNEFCMPRTRVSSPSFPAVAICLAYCVGMPLTSVETNLYHWNRYNRSNEPQYHPNLRGNLGI